MNAMALGTVVVLGRIFIPLVGAQGAALAAVVGETVLATTGYLLLIRALPNLKVSLRCVPRIATAAACGVGVAAVAGLAPLPSAVLATMAFLLLAGALGAVPRELLELLPRRGGQSSGT
jgi:O-antigen/teichoic acid export membrane protein